MTKNVVETNDEISELEAERNQIRLRLRQIAARLDTLRARQRRAMAAMPEAYNFRK